MQQILHSEIRELTLQDPFGISRGTKYTVHNLFVNINNSWGEGAPVYYLGQSADTIHRLAQEWFSEKPDIDRPIETIVAELISRYPNQSSLVQAIDIALHDAWGKSQNEPLYKLWNLTQQNIPLTSYTIGIDQFDKIIEKVEHAATYPILKIKVGEKYGLDVLEEIFRSTKKIFYVDANESWTVEQTLESLPLLREWNVKLLEQPISRFDIEGYRRIQQNNGTGIPIIQDEGLQGPEDIPTWAGIVDGINIKLAKCGGLARAKRTIELARKYRLQVMLGCMIESSVGVTAAAHLAPMVDYVDLDGAALLADDPFQGMWIEKGRVVIPNRPGISVTFRE